MSEQMMAAIALVAAFIVGRMHYKRVMSGGTKKNKLINKAKKQGCVATAYYVDSEVLRADSDGDSVRARNRKLRAQYEYRVNGIAYKKILYYINTGGVGLSGPPQVMVYYDAKNPKNAVCQEEASDYVKRQSGCLGSLGIGFAVVVVVVNLLKFLLR